MRAQNGEERRSCSSMAVSPHRFVRFQLVCSSQSGPDALPCTGGGRFQVTFRTDSRYYPSGSEKQLPVGTKGAALDKRFLFASLCVDSGYHTGINHGIASLVPVVRKYSYQVSNLNIRSHQDFQQFTDHIIAFRPSIVGFSCTSNQLKYLIKCSAELQRYPEILQIAGGPASTLDHDIILSKTAVKGACIGEGEISLGSLLNNIDQGKDIYETQGFYWNTGNYIRRNAPINFVSDLSLLDYPDYTVFNDPPVSSCRHIFIVLSRGCPYNCYYCCNMAISTVYPSPRRYFRVPTVKYSMNVLRDLLRLNPSAESIIFEDDLLVSDKDWFIRFAKAYKEQIAIPYRVCIRVECITRDTVEALKRSGCFRVFIGLESGSEFIRYCVLNKRFTNKTLIDKCKMIKSAGIEILSLNMIGFPFEKKEHMRETLELNKEISPELGVCSFFYPYKGTELYRICQKENLLKSQEEMMEITNFNTRPAIKMDPVQEEDCIYFHKQLIDYFSQRLKSRESAYL